MDNQLEQVEQIITYLQNIQSDIIGIIVPAIITAAVAMISLFINSMISMIQEKEKYNHEQFKYLQKIYPNLKNYLQHMRFLIISAKTYQNSFGSSLSNALQNYTAFKKDEFSYRSNHQSEIQGLDKFVHTIEDYIEESTKLHRFFISAEIPAMPLLHPFLGTPIREMLKDLQYWSFLLQSFRDASISESFWGEELNHCKLDDKTLQKYIELLDKWYQAY